MKKSCNFLREVFSDGGIGSFSNVATAVIVVAVLFWDTYLVLMTRKLPNLSEQALFIPVLYAVKKAANTVSDFTKK